MNPTTLSSTGPSDRRIRWGRIAIGAILLEGVLLVVAVPLLLLVDSPFSASASSAEKEFTIFFVSVAFACFVVGTLAGWWVARPLTSRFVLHGASTGIAATAIYLGICSIPPSTIASAFAAYGAFWFLLANGLRIVGSVLGAMYHGRGR